ncbi:MAG TPA: N-acetylmuramoyl-L-alanine amidase [Anaeromyxobacteraceae bacterium]|nr:N-acetylmuramoyl-L-alanine amidase [Anaeromyxobacteraceae bacterium]
MRIDEQGWLVVEDGDPPVKRYPTVKTTPLARPKPLGIVWHWTGGRGGPGFAEGLARGAQNYRRGIDPPASWSVLVAKSGTLFQSAPFLVGTWHVGMPGVIAGERFENINRATVGCELENAGSLRRIGDRYFCWPFFFNPGAPAQELRPDPHCILEEERVAFAPCAGAFDAFPPAQVVGATVLLRALVAAYGWSREACSYGHAEFDPTRREDPGALWKHTHLPRVLDTVFGEGNSASAISAPKAQEGA